MRLNAVQQRRLVRLIENRKRFNPAHDSWVRLAERFHLSIETLRKATSPVMDVDERNGTAGGINVYETPTALALAELCGLSYNVFLKRLGSDESSLGPDSHGVRP